MSRIVRTELLGGPFDGARVNMLVSNEGPYTDVRMIHPATTTPAGALAEHTCWYRIWHHDPSRAVYHLRKDASPMSDHGPLSQLGDATLHRCSGAGFFGLGETDFIVHQARGGSMKLGVRQEGVRTEAELKVDRLPEVIRSLIARSGRTDLTLHQTGSTNGES